MKKLSLFFALLIMIIMIGGLTAYTLLSNKVLENPVGTVGNTAGNLHNNGLFCEQDGWVYFANPYDENTLYVMSVDETDFKKLTTVGASSINVAGDFIYYFQNSSGTGSGLGYAVKNTGMYRITKDGKRFLCLKRDPAGILNLIDNHVYYQHYSDSINGFQLDAISIDKEEEFTVFESIISPACVVDGIIYYNNPSDHNYLYQYDTKTKTHSLVWEHKVYRPIYHTDGYLYYMDIDSDYELHRCNLYTQSEEVITTDRVETFNMYGDYIYYQCFSTDNPALKRVRTDGSGLETVTYGNYENINITSNYVYFSEYGKPTPVYHQSLYGPINVNWFQPQ